MMSAVRDYFATLSERFGDGWNRFWFTPSDGCTLSTIRVLTGMLALYWFATLTPDLQRFYGADGWLPLDSVRQVDVDNQIGTGVSPPTYLAFVRGERELQIAHGIGFLVLLMFAGGLFTRVSMVLATIVVLSYVHRAPMIGSQFEPVLTMMMIYLCIGRAGDYHSFDWLLRHRQAQPGCNLPPTSTLTTIAQRLMQLHVAGFYAVMGLSKLLGDPWWNGMGTWWLLTRAESRLVDLTWLPVQVVELWTHVIVAFELLFPILIWNRLARPLLLGIAVFIWISLALITGQVLFSLIMLVANLAFISPGPIRKFCGPFSMCCRTAEGR